MVSSFDCTSLTISVVEAWIPPPEKRDWYRISHYEEITGCLTIFPPENRFSTLVILIFYHLNFNSRVLEIINEKRIWIKPAKTQPDLFPAEKSNLLGVHSEIYQWYHPSIYHWHNFKTIMNGTNSYQETLNGLWHANVIDLTNVTNGRPMETLVSRW